MKSVDYRVHVIIWARDNEWWLYFVCTVKNASVWHTGEVMDIVSFEIKYILVVYKCVA